MSQKKEIYIQKVEGISLGSAIGKSALVKIEGEWYETSPIVSFCADEQELMIETKNTIYKTKKFVVVDEILRGFQGECGIIKLKDGSTMKTSVIQKTVFGDEEFLQIETMHSIYSVA